MGISESEMFEFTHAIWNQRTAVEASGARLHQLIAAVDFVGNMTPGQWGQLYASVLEFRPDLIVEFGRGRGNSTALFTEAAQGLPDCRVLSFCLSDDWRTRTQPRLAPLVSSEWFDVLDAQVGDIRSPEMVSCLDTALRKASRVLVLWDAHGFSVAEMILGHLLPQLAEKPHVVFMHDLIDVRYAPALRNYGGQGVWRGGYDQGLDHDIRVVLGPICSAVEQCVAIVDFMSRNQLELHSGDHDLHTGLTEEQRAALADTLGDLWQFPSHWFWFTAFGNAPLTYPRWDASECNRLDKTQLEQRIREMEASPFWKARMLFARLTGRP